jgi:hypothetical protein
MLIAGLYANENASSTDHALLEMTWKKGSVNRTNKTSSTCDQDVGALEAKAHVY